MKLLDLQEADTQIDSLNHHLGSIPEAAAIKDLQAKRRQADDAARDLRIQVDDLTDEQKRADRDVEQVKARHVRDQGMVDSGAIGDPKALERMLGELESLKRRITALEDVELEVMERLEEAQSALAEKEAEVAALDADIAANSTVLGEKQAQIKTDIADHVESRTSIAAQIPEDLGALYEKLRAQKGGVGAAMLQRKECMGCGLLLNAADLAAIVKAPTDEVLRCEECGRILVRTGESGI